MLLTHPDSHGIPLIANDVANANGLRTLALEVALFVPERPRWGRRDYSRWAASRQFSLSHHVQLA